MCKLRATAHKNRKGKVKVRLRLILIYPTCLEILLPGSRRQHVPHIPPRSLESLIDAIRASHQDLLTPPESFRDSGPWVPRVRKHIDWSAVTDHVTVSRHNPSIPTSTQAPKGEDEAATAEADEEGEPKRREKGEVLDPDQEPLTIGLIGQPNVGKSSVRLSCVYRWMNPKSYTCLQLLNAMFGSIKVRASRTPGKV